MIKAIIFDLDGTLVNTIGDIGHACNAVLEKQGFRTHSIDSYKEFVGNGLPMTIYRALPEDIQNEIKGMDYDGYGREPDFNHHKLESYVRDLITYYELHPTEKTTLYEGVMELLNILKAKGIKWGIHTNKTNSIAIKVADEFFDSKEYIGLKGPNQLTPRKPNPKGSLDLLDSIAKEASRISLDEVLFVGDSEVDIDTAKNLGVKVVAVSWGFRKEDFLKSLNPDYLIHHPMELVDILDWCS